MFMFAALVLGPSSCFCSIIHIFTLRNLQVRYRFVKFYLFAHDFFLKTVTRWRASRNEAVVHGVQQPDLALGIHRRGTLRLDAVRAGNFDFSVFEGFLFVWHII